jgi:hypothetical protein
MLPGRRSLFSSRLRLYPRRRRCLRLQLIAERPRVLKLSKRSLGRKGRPSRGTPTPLGYGYLTRHLPRKATRARLSGSASRQASPSARNEEETRHHAQMPKWSGLSGHNEQTPILRVPLQTGLRFHSREYEQPLHRRACGITNSGWLAGDRSMSSDNDLCLGRLNHSSDDLRANTVVKRPSPTSPLEGRGQAIKAGGLTAGGAGGLVGGETSSGDHHLSTDDSGHLHASATPMNGGRPSLHWQITTQVLTDGQAPTSARRRHARVRTRQSKNTNAAHAAYDVLDDPPVRTVQQSPVRWTDGHARIKRQEAASEAATEPAEPASQARWS